MKSPFAALAKIGTLAASVVLGQGQLFAQIVGSGPPQVPRSPFGQTVGEAVAPRNLPTDGLELTPASDLKDPQMVLPDEPIEPYLLTKKDGPFMVIARVFRGPDASRLALVLAKELRTEYGLPAYIFQKKVFPGGSMLRGVPPTVPSEVMAPDVKLPEKIRTIDEAAVLVGNAQTFAEQEKLWRDVRKIQPRCLEKMSSPFPWRKGLNSALRTTNPYIPAQNLYPRTQDKLVMQMNNGLHSVVHCPGQFSLQVAEFSGRSTFDFNTPGGPTHILTNLKESPLRTAHDDAERMAEKLAKSPEIQALGQPVYVYHDRATSKVFIGSFNAPQDPNAVNIRRQLVKDAYVLSDKKQRGRGATDTMIVPALALTDLSVIKSKLNR
jgi:hypothetical protein